MKGEQVLERNPPLSLVPIGDRRKLLSPAEQTQICAVLKRVADMLEQAALAEGADRAAPLS